MAAPQFLGPDGVLRDSFIFTTTVSQRFFQGTTDADTADMQVSIRGAAFTADPDFITFEGTSFTVPNPSVFPDGLQLLPGANVVKVLAVLSNGTTTAEASTQATLSLEQDTRDVAVAPSGVFLERFDNTVKVTVEGLEDSAVQGYNFYASTDPGGGVEGYSRITINLVESSETVEALRSLGQLSVDADIAVDAEGAPLADPLFYSITGNQQDEDEDVIQADFNEVLEISETVSRLRTTVDVSSVRQVQRFSFIHDRLASFDSTVNPAIPNADFNTIQIEDPLYYVVTAIYLIDGVEIESAFSPEVQGSPLTISTSIGSFPEVTQQQILRDATLSIFRSQPQLRIDPGSTTRDTFLDPFSTEAERIRFIVDFLHNAQSFNTLLIIDDPGLTGDSIDVDQSAYKLALRQAFYLEDNAAVQVLIDSAFDKLAANHGQSRSGGRRSRGETTFTVPSRPVTTEEFPIGTQVSGGSTIFRTTSFAQITSSGAGASFNPVTGRYSARAFIQADNPGNAGNLSPGQINTLVGGRTRVSVTNEARTFGGLDQESNRDLAGKVMTVLSAVDTGRFQGYVRTAVQVPGVLQVNVVEPGHPLMQRDRNPDTGRHVGGTVDLWIRGESVAKVTDSFAFAFEMALHVNFQVVGDIHNLEFRAVDSRLSTANPIIEMLDFPDIELVFKNDNTGVIYDLTNVEVISSNSIRLDSTLNTPAGIAVTHVFSGSFRFRASDKHVFTRQPVRRIRSLDGDPDRSGPVASTLFALFRGSDPLELGRSSEAGDYLQIIQLVGTDPVGIPSGDPIVVTDEAHIILSGIEFLGNLGINPFTVEVFNADRSVQFDGPFQNTSPDFTFIDEAGSSPLGILLTDGTAIAEGESLLADYQHDENFIVEYDTNSLIAVTQEEIDEFRHLTADALVKEAITVDVDITATVVLRRGQDVGTVDSRIRTELARLFNALELGEPLRQSDIIEALDAAEGVSYVVVPLTDLNKGDGSLVVREPVPTDTIADFFEVTDPLWAAETVTIFLLTNALGSSTDDSGGVENESRGVFANEGRLTHLEIRPNINGIPIKNATGQAFIIGSLGLEIPGFSDDATLEANFVFDSDPDIKAQQVDDKRIEITANRVLVSLEPGQVPSDFDFTVTYIVFGDEGAKNIEPGPTEFLDPGDFVFTYDEDTDFLARVQGRSR